MRKTIHSVSLDDLLCVVQSGSTLWLTEAGGLYCIAKNRMKTAEPINPDQAEAEIRRRFKRLNARIRKLLRERNDL